MNSTKDNKRFRISLQAATVVLTIALVGCGSGGGDNATEVANPGVGDTPVGSSPGTGSPGNSVPTVARRDGKSFVAWLQTMMSFNDEDKEPGGIGIGAIPADEVSEPVDLG